MRRYGDYVWACARRAAKGSVEGALNWGPIIGAGLLGAIYTYRGRTLSFADDWTGVVLSAVAYAAAAWLVIFTFRLLFVCPYQIWREQLSRLHELERRLSVKVVLRFEPFEPFRKPI